MRASAAILLERAIRCEILDLLNSKQRLDIGEPAMLSTTGIIAAA
jgi:hypothetical protein